MPAIMLPNQGVHALQKQPSALTCTAPYQPALTACKRRTSEESDEHLVNLFASENTPQNPSRRERRAPSASHVVITNEDSAQNSSLQHT